MLTKLDMDILDILSDDARTSASKIALMTGAGEDEVRASIARLEKERIIIKYPAMINWDRVRDDIVQALIEVRVTPQRGKGFDEIAERIYRYPEVDSVYLLSGGYDLMVILSGKSLRDVSGFVAQKLSTLDTVISTATHFILKKYKDHGTIMEKKEEDPREIITA